MSWTHFLSYKPRIPGAVLFYMKQAPTYVDAFYTNAHPTR